MRKKLVETHFETKRGVFINRTLYVHILFFWLPLYRQVIRQYLADFIDSCCMDTTDIYKWDEKVAAKPDSIVFMGERRGLWNPNL